MKNLIAASLAVSTLYAGSASAFNVNLESRPTAVPNSCEWGVFEAEFRLTNVDAGVREPRSYVLHLNFSAEEEIVPVHPRVYANVFRADGGYVGSTTANLVDGIDVDGQLPGRFANQQMRVTFDRLPAPGHLVIPENGGYMTFTVTYQRGDGLFPFDPECDDFSRIEPGAPYKFVSDPYFLIDYITTQPVCEFLAPGVPDPDTGLWYTGESFCGE